jgi:acetylglutamate kinase
LKADETTLKLVTMVYAGFINKNIVAKLQAKSCNAIGLSGADGNLILATKRIVKDIDYGFAGDIVANGINKEVLKILLENNTSPIIAPITHNGEGQLLNTNADTIANEIAIAMSAYYDVHLIYCFDKVGVLKDVNDEKSIIQIITKENVENLKAENIIFEGMFPKIDNALKAIANGVTKVSLGHASDLNKIIKGQAGTSIQK